MNDDATREMPVLNIADVTDMPTQTLPVHEPAHESTRKPANTQSVHAETAPAEPAHTESAHPQSARPIEPVDPSKQVHIGKVDGNLVIRPSGPSAGTIVLGVFLCLIGLMTMLCLLPIGVWHWMPNPQTLLIGGIGGLGVLLLITAAVWAAVSAIHNRRDSEESMGGESAAGDSMPLAK